METMLKAIQEAREWTQAQEPLSITQTLRPSINQDPNQDSALVCMYTDAAWNRSTECAGLSWIIDDAGETTSTSATSSFVTSPFIAETLAMRMAMISALNRGISSLLVLSDSQVLINLVISRGRNLEIACLLNDIQLLVYSFTSIQFKFITRTASDRADSVAKQALLYQT